MDWMWTNHMQSYDPYSYAGTVCLSQWRDWRGDGNYYNANIIVID